MSRDDWERQIKKVTKLDPGTRVKWETPPVREAMSALDQMKAVHGHTVIDTHGLTGFRFLNTFPPDTDIWNKNWEYPLFVKDALLREETTLYPERVLNEEGWMAVEAYAIEDTGVDEDIVYKGSLFRHSYVGCSKKNNCIKRNKDGSIDIDNECRQKCQDIAIKDSGFFTEEAIKILLQRSMV